MEKSTQPACPELAENNDRNPSTRSGRERSSALQVGNTTRKFPLVLFVFIGIYIALLMVAYDRLLGARTVKLNQQNPAMEGNTTAHEMAYIALSATILAARALSNDTSNRYFLDELNTFEQQAEIRELVYASETIRYEAMHPSWSVEHVTPFESSVMKTMIRLAKQERKNRIMNQEATAFYYPGVFLLGSPKTSSTLMWKVLTAHPQLCSACGAACAPPPKNGKKKRSFYSPDMCNCKEVFPTQRTPATYISHFGMNPKCIALSMLPEAPAYDYVDGTPMLADWKAPEKMANLTPPALQPYMRFLVLVREPVSRALSAYNHLVKGKKRSAAGFEEKMDVQIANLTWGASVDSFVTPGLAEVHFKNWLRFFPRTQFLVLQYDHIMQHTAGVIENVTTFLGLDPWDSEWLTGTLARFPKIEKDFTLRNLSCAALERYQRFFTPYNERLYQLVQTTRPLAPPLEPDFPPFRNPAAHCQVPPTSQ